MQPRPCTSSLPSPFVLSKMGVNSGLTNIPCPALPCPALPRCAAPCRAVPCRAVPCRAVPCRAVPCRAMPCRAVPCRALPCRAVPCPALPCRAVPMALPMPRPAPHRPIQPSFDESSIGPTLMISSRSDDCGKDHGIADSCQRLMSAQHPEMNCGISCRVEGLMTSGFQGFGSSGFRGA